MNRAVAMTALLCLAGCGPDLMGPESQVASKRQAIVNGKVTFEDPEIFAFLGPGWLCSSTLIGRRTILTAGHCVTNETNGGVIAPGGTYVTNVVDSDHPTGLIPVTAIRRHPNYSTSTGVPANDVALLQLDREPAVPLKPWNHDPLTDSMVATEIRNVGYGDVTGGAGAGLKRSGASAIKSVTPLTFAYGTLGSISGGTCQGDSGGPALRTFPDGTERVIGITSYGAAGCAGTSDDPRVDAYVNFIQSTLNAFEGTCAQDGVCKAGCTPVDPDCACVADGQCNAGCTGLALDPDCNSSCGVTGLCSTALAACGAADPDCQPLGQLCGYEEHCESRMCITSAQHPRPYCSKACTGASDCPSSMECASNRCQFKVLPAAALGEPCTPGATFCEGASMFCAGWATKPETVCSRGCLEDADCPDGKCRPSPQAPGVCVPNVTFTRLGTEVLQPPKGCASAPGALVFGLWALLGLGRRRTSSQRGRR